MQSVHCVFFSCCLYSYFFTIVNCRLLITYSAKLHYYHRPTKHFPLTSLADVGFYSQTTKSLANMIFLTSPLLPVMIYCSNNVGSTSDRNADLTREHFSLMELSSGFVTSSILFIALSVKPKGFIFW